MDKTELACKQLARADRRYRKAQRARERQNRKSYEARQIAAEEGKIYCFLPSTQRAFPSEAISWQGAKRRSSNPKPKDAHLYAHVDIDPRWTIPYLGFENFMCDMGKKPSAEHTIDRISKGYGYWPFNCRWADKTEQSRNRIREGQISLPIVF